LYICPQVNGEKKVFVMNVEYQGMEICVST